MHYEGSCQPSLTIDRFRDIDFTAETEFTGAREKASQLHTDTGDRPTVQVDKPSVVLAICQKGRDLRSRCGVERRHVVVCRLAHVMKHPRAVAANHRCVGGRSAPNKPRSINGHSCADQSSDAVTAHTSSILDRIELVCFGRGPLARYPTWLPFGRRSGDVAPLWHIQH